MFSRIAITPNMFPVKCELLYDHKYNCKRRFSLKAAKSSGDHALDVPAGRGGWEQSENLRFFSPASIPLQGIHLDENAEKIRIVLVNCQNPGEIPVRCGIYNAPLYLPVGKMALCNHDLSSSSTMICALTKIKLFHFWVIKLTFVQENLCLHFNVK